MDALWLATLVVASITWIAFAVGMRRCFRFARQANPAKDFLVRCATACTLIQMAALALCRAPSPSLAWAALACYGVAHLLYWWAIAVHGKDRPAFAFVSTAPSTLKASGPYGLVRHPIYTAYLIGWLAGPLATGQWWLLLTIAGMAALYWRAARQEEAGFLASGFADSYRAYQGRTGMFLPRLVPARRAA